MVLPIYLYGHPVIRKETEEIECFLPSAERAD